MNAPASFTRHFWLTRGMARTLGLNLGEALSDGRMTEADYAEMVANCCHCTQAAACVEWLGRSSGQAGAAPGFCRNRSMFVTLAARA